MTVCVIHLEVVSDLTAEAFLATFHRFTARRGKPSKVYSDNGTNYVAGEAELKRIFAKTSAMSQTNSSRNCEGQSRVAFFTAKRAKF